MTQFLRKTLAVAVLMSLAGGSAVAADSKPAIAGAPPTAAASKPVDNAAIDAKQVSTADAALVRQAVEDFDRVLGVVSLRRAEDAQPPVPVDEIEALIEQRKAARQRRDFAAADQIRKSLLERGILLEDNPAGTRWKKK